MEASTTKSAPPAPPDAGSRSRLEGWRRMLVAMLALMALGGGLRLYVAWQVSPLLLMGDENYYLRVARSIAQGQGHVDGIQYAMRAPAHPYLLSLFLGPDVVEVERTGKRGPARFYTPWSLTLLQVGLGTLLIGATALLGRLLFDERTGILAGLLVATYPTLIGFSHYLWSMNLFALLITLALAGIVLGERVESYTLAALTGLVFGVAALTRETGLAVAGAGVSWWLWMAGRGRRWPAALRGGLLLACAVAVILPWTWRNYRVLGDFVPVSNIGWFGLAGGNIWREPGWFTEGRPTRRERGKFIREYLERSDVEGAELARQRAFEEIRSDQPWWILKKSLRNPPQLLEADSYVLVKIKHRAYGEVAGSTLQMLVLALGASYIVLYLAGVLGVAGAGNGRGVLACLVFGVILGVHILVYAISRYRVPFMPFLMVYASHALLSWRARPRRLSPSARIVAALVIAHFLSLCVLHHYWLKWGFYSAVWFPAP